MSSLPIVARFCESFTLSHSQSLMNNRKINFLGYLTLSIRFFCQVWISRDFYLRSLERNFLSLEKFQPLNSQFYERCCNLIEWKQWCNDERGRVIGTIKAVSGEGKSWKIRKRFKLSERWCTHTKRKLENHFKIFLRSTLSGWEPFETRKMHRVENIHLFYANFAYRWSFFQGSAPANAPPVNENVP